ncbi:MAG TPA: hypothetical protein VNK06_00390 [Thermodesulfobacteriota bacterium]|nr:hypothetical protein [Thermodesulfobacteriota bacterium]
MDRQIRIRITKDGKVEIDSSVYKDCKEVAEHLTKNLGRVESFKEKDEFESEIKVKIEAE